MHTRRLVLDDTRLSLALLLAAMLLVALFSLSSAPAAHAAPAMRSYALEGPRWAGQPAAEHCCANLVIHME